MPVMLKRGLAATIEEWLMSAEYILSTGNQQVLLCERGIRTFDTYTRNTFDLTAIPLLHHLTHLPVIADPSHATGKRWLVRPMALAAVAAGADGIMVEVHPHPEDALSDGEQSLTLDQFGDLAPVLRQVHDQVRELGLGARAGVHGGLTRGRRRPVTPPGRPPRHRRLSGPRPGTGSRRALRRADRAPRAPRGCPPHAPRPRP